MKKFIVSLIFSLPLFGFTQTTPPKKLTVNIWSGSVIGYTDVTKVRNKLPSVYNSINGFSGSFLQSLAVELNFFEKAKLLFDFQSSSFENKSKNRAFTTMNDNIISVNYLHRLYKVPQKNWDIEPLLGIGIRRIEILAYQQTSKDINVSFDDYLTTPNSAISLANISLGTNVGLRTTYNAHLDFVKFDLDLLLSVKMGAYIPLADLGWYTPTISNRLTDTPSFYTPSYFLTFNVGVPIYYYE